MASNYGMKLQACVNLCACANAPPNLQPRTNPKKKNQLVKDVVMVMVKHEAMEEKFQIHDKD
jgi:hypothetical protein